MKKVTVAQFLSHQIDVCGKPQIQLASEVGWPKPNMITMIKQGKTKMPIDKVPAFAKALGIDPTVLMRLVLAEYQPDILKALDETMMKNTVTDEEMTFIKQIRKVSSNSAPLSLGYAEDRDVFVKLLHSMAERERKSIAA